MQLTWKFNNTLKNLPLSVQIKKNRNCSDHIFKIPLKEFADISLLSDLEKAALKIVESLRKNKKIIIFGHDDPDGITSTYILLDFFRKTGFKNITYYIPNRKIEHYGIQENLIKKILRENIDLLITVDNGIASYDAVEILNKKNIDVIITDHHLIPNKIPNAYAVVNPKREDSKYPDKFLAGVGVAYLLLIKIADILEKPLSENYLFWTALGTLADRVPLKKANRIIVRETFENWLLLDDELLFIADENFKTYTHSSEKQEFMEFLIPILHNGRDISGEHQALKMLLSQYDEKKKIFKQLYDKKTEFEQKRQQVDNFIQKIPEKLDKFLIFVDSDNNIPFELAGYFASEIADKNKIPTLILKHKEKDIWTCEARATLGFNLIDAFKFAADTLVQFGGHAQAAGFTIKKSNISLFVEKFKKFINNSSDNHFSKIINIDAIADCSVINCLNFLKEDLDELYPFGQDFFFPTILLENYFFTNSEQFIFENFEKLSELKKYDILCVLKKNTLKLLDYNEKN